jgi:rod shape-determining protein MreD
MVNNKTAHGGIWIVITVLIAMLMMMFPIPDSIRFLRPEWVVMTLIYWAMALPERVGIVFGWFSGLVVDVLMGGALGIHAFAYAFVVYFVLRFHLQLRQYPLWQQAFIILSMVFLVSLIEVSLSTRVLGLSLIMPAIFSTLTWPFLYFTLRAVRRNFSVR